jgi:two-component system chemotaxis response regulator CheY
MAQKILIVDDSSFMHSMYDIVLKKTGGCQVLHALNGAEGLNLLGQHPDCSLIILDINMPEMNGLEFIGHYRTSGLPRLAPIIIVSTEGKEEDTRRGLEAGAVAYLKKPFQPADLQALVRGVMAGGMS